MQAQISEMVSTQHDILAKLQLMIESVYDTAALGTGEAHLTIDSGVQGEHCPSLVQPGYLMCP